MAPYCAQADVRPLRSGTILSRACTIAADLIIVIISWRYAAQGFGWRLRRMPTLPLTRVMILNGSAYFLALLVLNALHLTLTMLSIVGLSEPASDVTEFTDPYVLLSPFFDACARPRHQSRSPHPLNSLTAILICRFLFALHAANLKSSAVSVDLYMNTSLNLDDTRPRIVGAFSALHYDADLGAQARSADPERTLQFASLVVESMGGAVGDEWDADELELELDADVEQGTSATEVDSASEGGPEQVSSGTTVWKNRR
ncbi:hypothetical protein BN946_scf184411.g3 [Trametes cinnabarina]|uniref:Uncharacterized protein n=1 Tax=Pycnoporus cinnabarinus TaxID=5643 RepID=A0A060SKM2_PYCCI|nr:hypothetical protein BN946_scf184411.g3 [Trametes cinnabarina]